MRLPSSVAHAPVRVLASCLALPLVLTAVGAQGQSPVPKNSDRLQPIQGPALHGQVLGIDDRGSIRFVASTGGEPVVHPLSAMRSVALHKRNPVPLPRQGLILLRSGVSIPGVVRETDGRTIHVSSPLFEGKVKFSLTAVQAIRFAKLPAEDEGGFDRYLNKPKEDKDLVYFKAPDGRIVQRSVTIEGFEDDRLLYASRSGRTVRKAMKDVYGLIMANDSGFRADPLPRPRVVLRLQGGNELRGRLDGVDGKNCKLFTEERASLNVIRSRVESIAVESDQLIFLTDIKPAKVEQTAAFRTKKPWMINRSPMGDGIQIGGDNPRTADNGLVLTPRTELTYDIGGTFDFFEATLCIDARSTGPAHAVFRVKDGDKVLYESKPVTPADRATGHQGADREGAATHHRGGLRQELRLRRSLRVRRGPRDQTRLTSLPLLDSPACSPPCQPSPRGARRSKPFERVRPHVRR